MLTLTQAGFLDLGGGGGGGGGADNREDFLLKFCWGDIREGTWGRGLISGILRYFDIRTTILKTYFNVF